MPFKRLTLIVLALTMTATAFADGFRRGSGFNEGDLEMETYPIIFSERISDPPSPRADELSLYLKDDAGTSKLYTKDSVGNVEELGSGGGGGTPGGSNGEYQYKDGSSFNASPVLTFDSTTSTATSTSLLANIFTVGTVTGVRGTATGGVLTLTEQNGTGTKNEFTLDLENNSRITGSSNTRNTFLWKGAGGNTTLTSYSQSGSAFLDASSSLSTGSSNLRVIPEGSNSWSYTAGGSSHATRSNLLAINSSIFGDVAQFNKNTGQAAFLGGDVTTAVIKTGTGGAGIDYKFLQVDGEDADLTQTWKEDEQLVKVKSTNANETATFVVGQPPSGFDGILDILAPLGYSAFGIGSPLVAAGFVVQGAQTTDNGPVLFLGVDAGTPLSDGAHIGSLQMGGSGGAPSNYAAGIDGYADGAWSSSSTPAKLLIRTTPSGVAGVPVERLAIYNDGNTVFNETGVSTADFRMESDNDTNMFLMDSSADTVSFGSATTTIGKTGTLGYVTTTTVVGSGTVGNTQAFLGKSSSVGCLMMRDDDNAGWTKVTALDGVLTVVTDADGVC